MGPLKINLQFLEHHKDQFLELHRELIKIKYAQQTNVALQNLKTLLELEISLLMDCDIEWGGEPEVEAPAAEAVLGASAENDDNDVFCDEGGQGGAGPAGTARGNPLESFLPAAPARGGGGGGVGAAAPAAPAAPAGGGGGGGFGAAAPAAPAAPAGGGGGGEGAAYSNLDFTTWTTETWDQLDFSQITFPTDSGISICSVRSYQAVAMLPPVKRPWTNYSMLKSTCKCRFHPW